MAALPNGSKVVRLDIHLTDQSDTNVQFRRFFSYAGALTQTDAQTWVNSIATDFAADMIGSFNTSTTFNLAVLTDLTSPSAAQAQAGAATLGTRAGIPLPSGVAVVVKSKIARRYRGGHPKVYLPSPTATQLTT